MGKHLPRGCHTLTSHISLWKEEPAPVQNLSTLLLLPAASASLRSWLKLFSTTFSCWLWSPPSPMGLLPRGSHRGHPVISSGDIHPAASDHLGSETPALLTPYMVSGLNLC